jgi:PAS domain S-box-containing protein
MTNLVEKILTGQTPETGGSIALFKAHPVASLIVGRDGRIADANPAAYSLFRCERAVLVGDSMTTFFPEIGGSVRETRRAVAHRRVAVRRPDGNNFIARLQLVPLDEDVGDTATLLATVEDLTEYEIEIAATNKELESFTSAAGHDLRGPLRILKGFTEALEEECGATLNEEGSTFLKEIVKASDRMEGLIDGMLAMSRAGRAEMTCENLDLTTLAELVDYELRHAETERQVEFKVAAGITGWGDVRLMMTVLRNLLGNAWKYTGRTQQASIRFYTEERDGDTWYCVSDNGAGFDMAHADRLFRPFTRLHRQDEFPGHGLGLATVQRIVKRHGGEIVAKAAIKQGATLSFRLRPPPQDR